MAEQFTASSPLSPSLVLRFPLGINTRAIETALPEGAVRDAVNVDFTADGRAVFAAGGYVVVAGSPGGHSLWSDRAMCYALYVSDAGSLLGVSADGTTLELTAVSSHLPMSYAFFNECAYYANGAEMGRIDSLVARSWGIDPPPAPPVSVIADGGMPAGRYLVAISALYDGGEESAPSPPQTVVLTAAGGIAVSLPTSPSISHIVIYCSSTTAANGEELFYHGVVTNGTAEYRIIAGPAGPHLRSRSAGRMPCGRIIAPFKRRMLAAIGNVLYFSEAEQVSRCDRARNWLQFNSPITCIAPVDDGCYVGTETAMHWCAGTDPTDWTRVVARPFGVAFQPFVTSLPHDAFTAEGTAQGPAVAWFSDDGGLCVGRNGGNVQAVTHGRVGMAPHRSAALFYRETGGVRHIISILKGGGIDRRSSPDSQTFAVSRNGITA